MITRRASLVRVLESAIVIRSHDSLRGSIDALPLFAMVVKETPFSVSALEFHNGCSKSVAAHREHAHIDRIVIGDMHPLPEALRVEIDLNWRIRRRE